MMYTPDLKASSVSPGAASVVVAHIFFLVIFSGCGDDAPVSTPIDYNNIDHIVYGQHVQSYNFV